MRPASSLNRVLIHPGFRKAGSTSTQRLLRKNRALLEQHLWLSVREDHSYKLRKLAMRYVHSRDRSLLSEIAQAARELRREVEDSGKTTALISDENLIGNAVYHPDGSTIIDWAAEILPILEDAFSGIEVEFYLMIRELEPWLDSAHRQAVINNRLREDFETWRAAVPESLGWENAKTIIRGALNSKVRFIAMEDELAKGSYLGRDLLEWALMPKEVLDRLADPGVANKGVSRDMVPLMLDINRTSLTDHQVRQVTKIIRTHLEDASTEP